MFGKVLLNEAYMVLLAALLGNMAYSSIVKNKPIQATWFPGRSTRSFRLGYIPTYIEAGAHIRRHINSCAV